MMTSTQERIPWLVRYRPTTFDDWIAPETTRKQLVSSAVSASPPHLLLSGPPGCGKTTAWLMFARQALGPSWKGTTHIYQARDRAKGKATAAFTDFLQPQNDGGQSLAGKMSLSAFDREFISVEGPPPPAGVESFGTGGGQRPISRLIVIEDADHLGHRIQPMLRGMMEKESRTTRFVMTCRAPSRLIDALRSRLVHLRLPPIPNKSIRNRLSWIFEQEKEVAEESVLDDITHVAQGDLRRALLIAEVIAAKGWLGDRSMVQEYLLNTKELDGHKVLQQALKGRTHAIEMVTTRGMKVERLDGAMGIVDDWFYEEGLEPSEVVHRLHLALVASGMMLTPDLQDELLSALAQMDGRLHSTVMQRAVVEEFMLACSEIGMRHGLGPRD